MTWGSGVFHVVGVGWPEPKLAKARMLEQCASGEP